MRGGFSGDFGPPRLSGSVRRLGDGMESIQESLVSILGTHYLQPITTLLEAILGLQEPGSDRIKTPYPENAHSASVCVLAAICFESCVMRLRFVNPLHHDPSKRGGALAYFESVHPGYAGIEDLRDVFVLRDALVHNHVWTMDFSWDADFSLKRGSTVKAAFSGDKKYAERVDEATRRTRRLGLHVVPIEVDRSDAFKVVRTVWAGLLYIDSLNLNLLAGAMLPLQFRGQKVRFPQVIDALPDA